MKNILVGICGIGKGHTLRQQVVINALNKLGHRIAIFAFGESYAYFKKQKSLEVFDVFVPWIHSGKSGVNYKKTANEKFNINPHYFKTNFTAMDEVVNFFKGKLDLVISDYEPISAQLAYLRNIPLITIDQQSKYLYQNLPIINNLSCQEEKERLRLFFPMVKERLACSFFKITEDLNNQHRLRIVPSFIREEIIAIRNNKKGINIRDNFSFLVYLSPFSDFVQSPKEIISIFSKLPKYKFNIFCKNPKLYYSSSNIRSFSYHDDKNFLKNLSVCSRVITTGGHNLLSELMFLGISPYVVPLRTYEQHYNALVLHRNRFGLMSKNISFPTLLKYIKDSNSYNLNIKKDKEILFKKSGSDFITDYLEKLLR